MSRTLQFYRLLLLLALASIVSCARINANLEGGEKDEEPPELIEHKSTQNFQTRWKGTPIEIEFNEWVSLKNKGQIIVSPPLEKSPEIELKGRKLIVTLNEDEILKDSTTYVVNFGESIVDYTEGNPMTNLQYVFSTGPVIDSLSLSGKVIDALTNEPVPNINVQLYDDLSDSTLINNRPYYLAKTDEDGRYAFSNLKSDTFQLFALLDNNLNYKFDGGIELVGFLDSLIILDADSLKSNQYNLSVFSEEKVEVLDTRHHNSRNLRLAMSGKPEGYTLTCEQNPILLQEFLGDTLQVWFETALDTNSVVVYSIDDYIDTLSWRKPKEYIDSFRYVPSLSKKLPDCYPKDPLEFVFNNPIDSIDNTLIMLADTAGVEAVTTASFEGKKLRINSDNKSNEQYTITLLPGAVKDIFAQQNDTIKVSFLSKSSSQFSTINLEFTVRDTSSQYLFTLLDSSKSPVRTYTLTNGEVVVIKGLLPATYTATILKDDNGNGIWDTGSMLKKKYPESLKTLEVEKLRENWDIELKVDWDSL